MALSFDFRCPPSSCGTNDQRYTGSSVLSRMQYPPDHVHSGFAVDGFNPDASMMEGPPSVTVPTQSRIAQPRSVRQVSSRVRLLVRMGTVGKRKEGTLVLVRTLRSLGRTFICNLTLVLPTLFGFWPDMITVSSIGDYEAGLGLRCNDRTGSGYILLVTPCAQTVPSRTRSE